MTGFRLGYNTNGFAHHRLDDCLAILADLGYRAVGLTLDVHHLDPFRATPAEVDALRARLEALDLLPVIETGARYLLDPTAKHQPTLLSSEADGRRRRIDFLERSIDLASLLGAPAVSFWSGQRPDGVPPEAARTWLVDACRRLAERAAERAIALAFEPEPGMFVASMADFEPLPAAVGHPAFRLTIDVGHLLLTESPPLGSSIERWADLLANVHIEDMRRPVHEHLLFGEGEVPFAEVLGALLRIGFEGPVTVELSRHSHAAPVAAARSIEFLGDLLRRI